MKNYTSTMSKGYRLTTLLLLVFIVGMISRLYFLLDKTPELSSKGSWLWVLCCVLPVLVVYCYGAQLHSLRLDEDSLTIVRKWSVLVIPRADILEVGRKKSVMWDTDLWGMNGLFGSVGWFYEKSLGRYFSIVNNGNSMIVIKTKKRTYVVNCDERDEFLKNFERK